MGLAWFGDVGRLLGDIGNVEKDGRVDVNGHGPVVRPTLGM
jgi:hypothetical protein